MESHLAFPTHCHPLTPELPGSDRIRSASPAGANEKLVRIARHELINRISCYNHIRRG
jgi:hypothetical protein